MNMRTTSDARSGDVSQVLCFKAKFGNRWEKRVKCKVCFVFSREQTSNLLLYSKLQG